MMRGRRQAAERLEIGDEVLLTSGVYGIVTGFFADGVVSAPSLTGASQTAPLDRGR